MNTDRNLQDQAARRARARRVAWIAAGAAVAGTLTVLGPLPTAATSRAGVRLLEQSAPAVPQLVAALGADIDWDAVETAADPAPAAVAAYEH